MPMNDTITRYGAVSRLFHWTIAALLVWQFGGMIYKEIAGRTPLTAFWVGSHKSVGTLLLVLIVGRIVWALTQRGSRPPAHAGLLGAAARVGHGALYLLMLVVPSLAFLRMLGGKDAVEIFGVTVRGERADSIPWMTEPASLLHGNLAWVFLALIAGHVAMVVVHRFWLRDDTLARMAGDPNS